MNISLSALCSLFKLRISEDMHHSLTYHLKMKFCMLLVALATCQAQSPPQVPEMTVGYTLKYVNPKPLNYLFSHHHDSQTSIRSRFP